MSRWQGNGVAKVFGQGILLDDDDYGYGAYGGWVTGKSWQVEKDLKKMFGCVPEDAKNIQEFSGVGEPVVTGDIMQPKLYVGGDLRIYRDLMGIINARVPVAPKNDKPNIYIESINWDMFPPMQQLAFLFDNFFNKYDREVLMIYGKTRASEGWTFMVVDQVGTPAHVKWNDESGMEEFSRLARWVGTIHVHPGSDCSASGVDLDDWEKPEKSGLHIIFGRKGDYKVYGALAGCVWLLLEGNHNDLDREEVAWHTSGNRDLDTLLKVPPPVKVNTHITICKPTQVVNYRKGKPSRVIKAKTDFEKAVSLLNDDVLVFDRNDEIVMVEHGGKFYMMIADQYEEVCVRLGNDCPDFEVVFMKGDLQ